MHPSGKKERQWGIWLGKKERELWGWERGILTGLAWEVGARLNNERETSVECCFSLRVWAMSQVITSLHLIHHFPQTNECCVHSCLPPLPFSRFSLSLSRWLSLAVGQWICVRAMTGDQTRAVSVWQCVWTRFLCVSVWNNTSGCVREQLSKELYSVFLSETCVLAAHWVSVWEYLLCTSIFWWLIQRQNYGKSTK